MTRTVAYFGTYDPSYPRNAVLLAGPAGARGRGPRGAGVAAAARRGGHRRRRAGAVRAGAGVRRRASAPWRSTAAASPRGGRRRVPGSPRDAVRAAGRGVSPGARLVFDPLVSLADTFVGDRGLVSARARRCGRRRAASTASRSRAPAWCSPTRGSRRRTTALASGCRATARRGAGRGGCRSRGDRHRPGPCTRRAADRLSVRQVEPTPRGRDRARGRRAACAAGRCASSWPARDSSRRSCARRSADAGCATSTGSACSSARRSAPAAARGRRVSRVSFGAFGEGTAASCPTKVFDGLACGRPVVTAASPGARELLHDGEDALLVPPGDGAALAAALRTPAGRGRARQARRQRRSPSTAAPAPPRSWPAGCWTPSGGAVNGREGPAPAGGRRAPPRRPAGAACCASRSAARRR